MLLILLDAALLLFISLSLGEITRVLLSRWFSVTVSPSFFEKFLLGLITTSVWFNMLSFLVPVNWLGLMPLLFLAVYWQWKHPFNYLQAINRFRDENLGNRIQRFAFFLLMGMILLYWFLPPYNYDSPDYHYQSIYWYEHYKVIPGLGNVHGRLAFNPATFILSAGYAFSGLTGQAIYTLNPLLVLLFYAWLFQLIMRSRNDWSALVYIITAFLLFRPLLANIPSPASEPLVTTSVATVFLSVVEAIRRRRHHDPAALIVPVCIAAFAVTAKLTSLPVVLVPLLVLYWIPSQRWHFLWRFKVIGAVIVLPWVARNVILSGYLFYPLWQIDLFSVDWKVPKDIAFVDYALGTFASKGEIDKNGVLVRTSFEWMWPWLKHHMQAKKAIDFLVLVLCFTSPFVWLLSYKAKQLRSLQWLWLCAFTGSVVWLLKAPEYRFGMGFLVLSFAIPMIAWLQNKTLHPQVFTWLLIFSFLPVIAYYLVRPISKHPRLHTIGLEKIWWLPLKDSSYYLPVDMKTFRYQDLGHGVKVYIRDQSHHCLQVETQPCMMWYYGKIRMRGNSIQDGFRNLTVETRTSMPFIYGDDQPK